MRYVLLVLLTFVLSVDGMQCSTPERTSAPGSAQMQAPELPGAARVTTKRKNIDLPVPGPRANATEQVLVDYLNEHLPAQKVEPLLNIIFRAERNIYNETYFDDYHWLTNDGRDLLKLSKELIQLISSDRRYSLLAKSPEFMAHLVNYLTRARYPETTNSVRAVIPFAALPAAALTIQKLSQLPDFEQKWCNELKILDRWLDAASEPSIKDPFYEEDILLLINGLPAHHPLLSKEDSCVKHLLFHTIPGNYDRILDTLLKKGVNVNWKNAQDETPLYRAAFRANESMVRKILKAGADVNVRSIFRQTTLDFAKFSPYSNKNRVIKLLIDHGAKQGDEL